MKYFLLFIVFILSLFSEKVIDIKDRNQGFFPKIDSPISLPQTEILKPKYLECNLSCLNNFLNNDLTFSFLAYVQDYENKDITDLGILEKKLLFDSFFNILNSNKFTSFRIAVIIPEKIIGRYSEFVLKSIYSYIITRNIEDFEIKTYYIGNETNQSIAEAINQITIERYQNVIAPFTIQGAKILNKLHPNIYIYIPTVNIHDIDLPNRNILFGGINYRTQIQTLLKFIDRDRNISLFYDNSSIGKKLNNIVLEELNNTAPEVNISLQVLVSKRVTNFAKYFKDHNETQGNMYFINTTQDKNSIILAQLTTFDQQPSKIFTTQTNYSSLILDMTQPYDRKNVYIANVISKDINNSLVDTNSIFDNDIFYDWVNYSTSIGLDYFFHLNTGQNRLFREPFINNQVQYKIRIMRPKKSKFDEMVIIPSLTDINTSDSFFHLNN